MKSIRSQVWSAFTGLVGLVLFLGCCTDLKAQLATATLSGVVSDATGAAIPGAQVTLQSTLEQASRDTVTDSTGAYVICGTCRHAVTPSGFVIADIRREDYAAMLLSAVLFCSITLMAQVNYATVVGTVKDATGAVIPDAALTLRNLGTGAVRTITSDASGDYTIPNLDVGHYSLIVTMRGFKTTTMTDFKLDVGQSARIDPVLEVGVTTQQVNVTGAAQNHAR